MFEQSEKNNCGMTARKEGRELGNKEGIDGLTRKH